MGSRDGLRPTWPRDDLRPTSSRDESRPAASRDELRPAGSRDAPEDPRDDSRPRDGPRDAGRPNGPRGAPKTAAILRPSDDASNLTGPPAAILSSSSPRRRGGMPSLPLTLGPLTVHSLGAVGAGPAAILPLGFRSPRLFASLRRPARRCLYTCRIVTGPRCEIVAEDEPGRVLVGPTPDAVHARLLQALGEAGGRPRGPPHAPGAGDDFFGLTHPVVRRHLQGEAGAFIHPEEEDEE
ncbi:TBRG1 regulator, partial [Anseranas semipalmata]|nr:TBRG1 regulator [Anseranas semipalmata]